MSIGCVGFKKVFLSLPVTLWLSRMLSGLFEGNSQEYEADDKRRYGEEASRPHRIKYKPLTRS